MEVIERLEDPIVAPFHSLLGAVRTAVRGGVDRLDVQSRREECVRDGVAVVGIGDRVGVDDGRYLVRRRIEQFEACVRVDGRERGRHRRTEQVRAVHTTGRVIRDAVQKPGSRCDAAQTVTRSVHRRPPVIHGDRGDRSLVRPQT